MQYLYNLLDSIGTIVRPTTAAQSTSGPTSRGASTSTKRKRPPSVEHGSTDEDECLPSKTKLRKLNHPVRRCPSPIRFNQRSGPTRGVRETSMGAPMALSSETEIIDLTRSIPKSFEEKFNLHELCLDSNKDRVFTTVNNIPIRGEDFKILLQNGWLSDEVINAYMSLMHHASSNSYHLFNSAFYRLFTHGKMFTEEYNYNGVRRWTKKVDIFKKELILVPINIRDLSKDYEPISLNKASGVHWILGVINIKEKQFAIYDSLWDPKEEYFNDMRAYLKSEYQDKKGGNLDLSDWMDYSPREIPMQKNSFDCGVFILLFAKALLFQQPMNFSQDDIPGYRKQITLECLKGSLTVEAQRQDDIQKDNASQPKKKG